jgi:hypothetical protein
MGREMSDEYPDIGTYGDMDRNDEEREMNYQCSRCGTENIKEGVFCGCGECMRMHIKILQSKLTIALSALKAVEEHRHKQGGCAWQSAEYEEGCARGHRCAAAICRKAREEIEKL